MIIFDVEASGLSDASYPIEVAWQDSDDPDCFDSFLINPSESWKHWDDYAEQEIHHISRNTLYKEGVSIAGACTRLNTKLAGKTIYSDAIEYDQRWLLKLFDEVGMTPKFSIGSIYHVIDKVTLLKFESSIENEFIVHRALDDARQIIRLLFTE
ncbi:hypothetical protein [Alkalimarinus coralli]|uniref:hypothetical protein n=1 Tax=Alkalimarinus coralli TaxID=2935863 RepID=UPI00202B5A7A|nr:hypothetical protein [Alkalimarinus coralli]